MPLAHEHTARLQDPRAYVGFRREEDAAGPSRIYGVKQDGSEEVQALRFAKDRFTPEAAQAWLTANQFQPLSFQSAAELVENRGQPSWEHVLTQNAGCQTRHEDFDGKRYLVVPMVMLTEGVHQGSQGPLYYPPEELKKTPAVWNTKPIVVYHPKINGVGVSACTPEILSSRKVGMVMGARYEDGKLKAEAWLEDDKMDAVDPRIRQFIQNGQMMEVSTGLFTDNIPQQGEWRGEKYQFVARNYRPDHLALLPDETGACSLADGAGLLRNQQFEEGTVSDRRERVFPVMNGWVTLKGGTHVFIGSGGKISKGPKGMVGKKPNELGKGKGGGGSESAENLHARWKKGELVRGEDGSFFDPKTGKTIASGGSAPAKQATKMAGKGKSKRGDDKEGIIDAELVEDKVAAGARKVPGMHNQDLPQDRKRLQIPEATEALSQMGYKLGKAETDLKAKKTSYEVTGPDGKTTKMTSDEIKNLVYEGQVTRSDSKRTMRVGHKTVVTENTRLEMSPAKACKILRDGTVHGQPLTEKQRGLFGALCGKMTNNAEADGDDVHQLLDEIETDLIENAVSHGQLRQTLQDALTARFGPAAYVEDVYPKFFVYCLHAHTGPMTERTGPVESVLYKLGYTASKDGAVELANETPAEVVRVTEYQTKDGQYVANVMMYSHMEEDEEEDTEEAPAEPTAKKPSKKRKMTMNKETLVDRLISNTATRWDDEDREFLMELDEDQLAKLEPTEMVANAKPLTEEEWWAAAPADVKRLVTNAKKIEDGQKEKLVAQITANSRNKFTEDYLKTKDVEELEAIAALAVNEEPQPQGPVRRFSGAQGAAPVANAAKEPFKPRPLVMPKIDYTAQK